MKIKDHNFFFDYYKLLEIKRDASTEEIAQARLNKLETTNIKEYSEFSEEDKREMQLRTNLLNKAHEVLSKKEKRKKYDELLEGFDSLRKEKII